MIEYKLEELRMIARIAIALCCVLVCLSHSAVLQAQDKDSDRSKVMILPFDGSSAGKFNYLTDPVRSMVTSRLAGQEGVEVVDYGLRAADIKKLSSGEPNPDGADSVFSKFDLDYIVTGGLYALQTGLKIQVAVAGKDTAGEPVRLNVLAINEESVIGQVGQLVDEIAGKGFGLETSGALAIAVQGGERDGLSGFTTEHPEKLYKKGVYSGAIVTEDGGVSVSSQGVRRSSVIPIMLVTMATGDLDGDGMQEIVTAARTSLSVFRFNDTRFMEVASYKFPKSAKINAVNIADLNGDGKPEIYVSANNRERASSAIFALTGNQLQPLVENINWFIRPLNMPGDRLVLAGQRASAKHEEGYLRPGVSILSFDRAAGKVSEEKKLPLPERVNLFDFEWADLEGDNKYELIAVDHREKLLVYDNKNSLVWVSEKDYGGSRNFFGPAVSEAFSFKAMVSNEQEEQIERKIVFIPARIVVKDIDGDGNQEIIIGQNKRLYGKWFSNSREYDGGSVVCLDWRQESLQESWRTNKINGYVADYNYVKKGENVDGGETDMAGLYVAQIPERMMFGVLLRKESKLLRYDLEIQNSIQAQ